MNNVSEHIDQTYRYVVEDHSRNPRNCEPLQSVDAEARIENPFCGDEVLVQLKIIDDRLSEICVQGSGCVICQASASIMSETIQERQTTDIVSIASSARRMFSSEADLSQTETEQLGDVMALQAVRRFPVRIKCALLAWAALEDALSETQ